MRCIKLIVDLGIFLAIEQNDVFSRRLWYFAGLTYYFTSRAELINSHAVEVRYCLRYRYVVRPYELFQKPM